MPGLLRGMARTAVVAGTATAVSNRVSRRQAERWAREDQSAYYQEPQYVQQAPVYVEQAPPPPAAPDPIEQLTKLGQLRDSGVLTEEEFAAQKAKILGL
jgi:Short C-terminal domain